MQVVAAKTLGFGVVENPQLQIPEAWSFSVFSITIW
jgi:hypothetical protein